MLNPGRYIHMLRTSLIKCIWGVAIYDKSGEAYIYEDTLIHLIIYY